MATDEEFPCEDVPEPSAVGDCDCHTEPVPPHYVDAADTVAAELEDATAQFYDAAAEQLSDIDRELRAAETELNVTVAEMLGRIDTDLRAVGAVQWDQVVKHIDMIARDLILAEETLKAEGYVAPVTLQQRLADADDTTGERIMARLLSMDPDAGESVPVNSVAPSALPLAADGLMTEAAPPMPPPASPPPPPDALPSSPSDAELVAKYNAALGPPPVAASPSDAELVAAYNAALAGASAPAPFNNPLVSEAGSVPPPFSTVAPSSVGTAPRPTAPAVMGGAAGALNPASATAPPVEPARANPLGIAWDRDGVCASIHQSLDDARRAVPTDVGAGFPLGVGAPLSFVLPGAELVASVVDFFAPEGSEARKQLGTVGGDIVGSVSAALGVSEDVLKGVSTEAVPDPKAALALLPTLALANRVDMLTGAPISYLTQSIDYLYRAANPQYIPGQAELNAAYMTDQITLERWQCLTSAHGNKPDMYRWALYAMQQRPDVREIIDLYRRGQLSRDMMSVRLRDIGVTNAQYADEWVALMQYVPTPPDVARYMMRDVFDPDVVTSQKLDTGFEEKLFGPGGRANPGPAIAWLKAHGINEEVMLYDWRAHWQAPSNTIAFDALHRLREDRPDMVQWSEGLAAADDRDAYRAQVPQPLFVKPEEVRELLLINDMFPAWVDRAMAMSYRPLTNTDCVQAFMQDAMNADELVERFMDNGHDRPTAKRKVEIQQALKARRTANVSGVWTIREIANRYREGALSVLDAQRLLTPLMPDQLQRADLLNSVDAQLTSSVRAKRIARIRKSFIQGVWSREQTLAALQDDFVLPPRSTDMVDGWDEDRRGRLKEPTAMRIIKWVQLHLIEAGDAVNRLVAIGYGDLDSARIVSEGLIAASKDQEKRIKDILKDEEKAVKNAKQARKEDRAELEKRQKELEKKKKEVEKEQERIKKELDARIPSSN